MRTEIDVEKMRSWLSPQNNWIEKSILNAERRTKKPGNLDCPDSQDMAGSGGTPGCEPPGKSQMMPMPIFIQKPRLDCRG
jgi:hypothetical protein